MTKLRTPLIVHWSNPESYGQWSSRAEQVVRHIRPSEKWVCDIGCGLQAVRKMLPTDKVYLPADVKQWTPDTAVCDLEVGKLPLRYLAASDVCLMLGVIEYIDDPALLFRRLAPRINRLLVTYSTTDGHPTRNPLWINQFSERQFRVLLTNGGFNIEARHFIEDHRQVFIEARGRKALHRRLMTPLARMNIRYYGAAARMSD